MEDKITMHHYHNLANAIILQAAKDFRYGSKKDKAEAERFFYSDWFTILTNLDPEVLVTRLKEEM